MVSSRSLLLAGFNKAFNGIVVFLSNMEGQICKRGYVFGKHIRNTTAIHLKGLRHIMYMNGATEDHYKIYISLKKIFKQTCKGRSTNRVDDNNWNCYNKEIN